MKLVTARNSKTNGNELTFLLVESANGELRGNVAESGECEKISDAENKSFKRRKLPNIRNENNYKRKLLNSE